MVGPNILLLSKTLQFLLFYKYQNMPDRIPLESYFHFFLTKTTMPHNKSSNWTWYHHWNPTQIHQIPKHLVYHNAERHNLLIFHLPDKERINWPGNRMSFVVYRKSKPFPNKLPMQKKNLTLIKASAFQVAP